MILNNPIRDPGICQILRELRNRRVGTEKKTLSDIALADHAYIGCFLTGLPFRLTDHSRNVFLISCQYDVKSAGTGRLKRFV